LNRFENAEIPLTIGNCKLSGIAVPFYFYWHSGKFDENRRRKSFPCFFINAKMKIFISAKVHDGFLLITIFDKALSLEIAEAMEK